MTRLMRSLEALRSRGDRALICYLMGGDPTPARAAEIVVAVAEAGADVIELGIPFSDPLADGPSIQAAGQRALNAGTTVPVCLDIVRQVRRTVATPIVLMTYLNPILSYGLQRFAADAAQAGADGAILVDLTPDEAREWQEAAAAAGLGTVFLLAPTSTPERIRLVGRLCTGFVYCVARTGVTGARVDLPPDLPELLARVRAETDKPVGVGFGISTAEQVRTVAELADGVIVGSALVNVVAEAGDSPDAAPAAAELVRSLKAGTRRA
ncbi:MAG: tryptophan synthase subunit alpha [Armatimonadetes bacterium]|nr:tryptophan synthase subunit alpha [Armatimonadota bacterium]